MEPDPSARRVLGLARPYAAPLLVTALLVSLQAGVALAAPRVAGVVVDTVIDPADVAQSLARLDLVVLLLIGLFALRGLLTFAEAYLLRATGARMLRDLRDRVYSQLVGLGPDFYQERRVGELLSRIGSDLSRVQSTLTTRLPGGVRAGLTFAGTLIIMFTMNPRLTLVTLAVIPPIVVLSLFYGGRLQRIAQGVQDSLAETSAAAEEALSGIRTVQAYGGEESERQRYRRGLGALLGLELRSARLTGAFLGVVLFVGYAAFALVLWYGGRLILLEALTPGQLTAFLLYAFAIAGSVESLGSLYTGLRELRGASRRVFEILATRPTVVEGQDARPLAAVRGAVGVRDLTFCYPGSARPALDRVSLTVDPGEVVALVGPSGAGKSTLFSLLLRFRDPQKGRVEVDGQNVREVSLASLRSAMALVPQEIFLFGGSVAENIRYGRPRATDREVESAARAAGADAFVRALPDGYATVVGARGVKLSSGERQRIAIARAFLREPAILLLDEATSSLDAESEARVQEALTQLMRGRTTLVIAHRLSTARRADRVVVLEAGRIAAVGTDATLRVSNDLYRRYWELQALEPAT